MNYLFKQDGTFAPFVYSDDADLSPESEASNYQRLPSMSVGTYQSLPVITITNNEGTKTWQPQSEEEYAAYMKERDENHQKTADAIGLLVYSVIGLIGMSAYSIYLLYKK